MRESRNPAIRLDPLDEFLSEQSLGPYQKHGNDNEKGQGVFEGNGDVGTNKALGYPQNEAVKYSAWSLPPSIPDIHQRVRIVFHPHCYYLFQVSLVSQMANLRL